MRPRMEGYPHLVRRQAQSERAGGPLRFEPLSSWALNVIRREQAGTLTRGAGNDLCAYTARHRCKGAVSNEIQVGPLGVHKLRKL